MIAALDVHYSGNTATAAAVVFENWSSNEAIAQYTALESPVAAYEAGQFYMRELSPLLTVIKQIKLPTDTYIIDGYCHLSSDFAPGLGVYLNDALGKSATIVGVAKNRYRDSQHAIEVLRATSKRPLFVTSIGISYEIAAQNVASMAGQYRIPEMLKAVNRLSRISLQDKTAAT